MQPGYGSQGHARLWNGLRGALFLVWLDNSGLECGPARTDNRGLQPFFSVLPLPLRNGASNSLPQDGIAGRVPAAHIYTLPKLQSKNSSVHVSPQQKHSPAQQRSSLSTEGVVRMHTVFLGRTIVRCLPFCIAVLNKSTATIRHRVVGGRF